MFRFCTKWKRPLHRLRKFSTVTNLTAGKYRPRRVVMYVPGMDRRKMEKIPSLGADTVVFDMEDGVAADQKVVCKCLSMGSASGKIT